MSERLLRQVVMVQAAIARAQIRAAGMTAENQQRAAIGASMAYVDEAFERLIDDEGLGVNAVILSLQE